MKKFGSSFPCPACGGKSVVKDSRPAEGVIRRRRMCRLCGHRWTTWETIMPVIHFGQHLKRLRSAVSAATAALQAVANDLSLMETPDAGD